MKLKLKVCGLRQSENIRTVASLYPDFLGFIYYAKSPRFVGHEFQMPLTATSNRVGVFVNESVTYMLNKVKSDKLDMIQLHGHEQPAVAKALVENDVQVMKVFSVDSNFDFRIVKNFIPYSKYLLFDTKTSNYGGSGKRFNWNLLHQYEYSTPFFLSGGISPENIQEVAEVRNPAFYGVDVNSGVEDSPGLKNPNRLQELIQVLKTI